jgi:multidrug resistance efflux pump
MKAVRFCLVPAFVIAILVAGCAKPPVEDMDRAEAAVARAENDGDATTYAQATLDLAREALGNMRAEAEAKRYDSAKAHAADAVATAERAIAEGRDGAERARGEAQAILFELPPLIAQTEQGIDAAQSAGLDLDFDSLYSDLSGAVGNSDRASDAFASGKYAEATAQGRTARNGLSDINMRIAGAAVVAPSGKKK